MKARITLILVLSSSFSLAGCASTNNPLALLRGEAHVGSSMTPILSIEAPPRAADCHLDLVLDRSPERPYIVIGLVAAIWTGTDRQALNSNDSQIVPQLRARACQAGGHALFHVSTHYQDDWIPRTSSPRPPHRNALVRTIRGTALVAVYVRRNGSVMAPPERPRQVIRVPTRLERPIAVGEGEEDSFEWDQGIVDPWAVPVP